MSKLSLILIVVVSLLLIPLGGTPFADDSPWQTGAEGIYYNGNIGIGTTSPAYKLDLHVSGSSGLQGMRTIQDSTGDAVNYIITQDGGGDPHTRYAVVSGKNWYVGIDNSDSDKFKISESGIGGTDHVTILGTSGNVGIGTTSPDAQLHVFTTSGSANIIAESSASGQQGTFITRGRSYGAVNFRDEMNATKAAIVSDVDNNWMSLRAGGGGIANEAMRLKSNGNVGIGTTSPQYKLAVKGTIAAEEIKVVDTSGWADFVFDEDYQLPSLESVESFVQKEKHLPDIPTAKEIKQNGLAVSEILAKQMQKIEELTLYLIKLKKQNSALLATQAGLLKRLEALEKKAGEPSVQ